MKYWNKLFFVKREVRNIFRKFSCDSLLQERFSQSLQNSEEKKYIILKDYRLCGALKCRVK
jgi:hypothetical protein